MEIAHSLLLADGVSIAYRLLAGGGRGAIVLLHGLASNLTRWSEFVERTTLKQHWVVLRVDLRGHGDSVASGRVTLESWCDDLAAILEREGCTPVVLVGHSLGAQVALHFAARFPARTRGLVLIDPVFRQALRGRWRLIAAIGPVFALAAAIVRAANALGLQRPRIEPLDLRELDRAARRALLDKASEREFIRRYSSTRADLRHFRTAHYLQELYEMFRPAPALDSLRLPVLVLLSSGGTFARAADMEPLLGRLPDAQTQRIDCHHWPLTEKPDEVRHAIERWIESRIED